MIHKCIFMLKGDCVVKCIITTWTHIGHMPVSPDKYGAVYHKGALAPLYIGIVVVGQHRSHTFGKSAFPWQ